MDSGGTNMTTLPSPPSSTLEQQDDMDNTEDDNNAPPQQQGAKMAKKSDDEDEDAWIEVPTAVDTADDSLNAAETVGSDMHDGKRPEIHQDVADAANNNTADETEDGKPAIRQEGDTADNEVDEATTAKFGEDNKLVDIAVEQKSEDENVEDLDSEEGVTREDLKIALEDINSPGSSCTSGPTSLLPADPRLHIKGVGHISMPLTDAQAKALSNVAAQAPHGQGMKTVIDKSVRNTWQIEPDQVTMEHPSWSTGLQALTAKVAIDLGLSPNDVQCKLYKLLLYEKGGFFKTHRDTEKVNGMFGTLVVQLPSHFTGGNFVVTHDGVTKRFDLGSGTGRSADGYYVVAHYADCEHAIEEVTSGNRLALVYSLSFTGVGSYKSSSPVTGSHERKLKRILRGLDVGQRICMIPLRHQYTTASLGSLGLNALKGKDKDCQKAMEVASEGTWKFIIACVYKTDKEFGEGDKDSGDFELDEVEPGVPYFVGQAFGADGSDRTSDLAWLGKIANFRCVEDGGMLLVSSSDDMADIWGEGDSESVEYTGNDGATRETTYETYFLVAYATEMEFDWMVSGDLARCIDVVATEKDESKILRLLNHISRTRCTLSFAQFEKLLPLVSPSTVTPCEDEIAKLKQLFGSVNMKAKDVITNATFEFLDWFVTAKDTSPEVKSILEAFFSKPTSSAGVMLLKAEMAAYFVTRPSCESLADMLASVTKNFTPESEYAYKQRYYSPAITSDQDIKRLNSFVNKYSWALAEDSAMAMAWVAVEREMMISLSCFERTIDVLLCLMELARGDAEFQRLCDMVATKCENDIEKPALFFQDGYYYYGRQELPSFLFIHDSKGKKVFKLLLYVGKTGFIVSMQTWIDLWPNSGYFEKLERTLRSADASTQHASKGAVQSLLEMLQNKIRASKLAALLIQRDALLQETQTPPPEFSWSMPDASYPENAEIQEFLRGPQQCLPQLVVGGGIRNARLMSSSLVHSTFSAIISAGRSTGKNAYVTVTKTRDYHEKKVRKYNAQMAELSDVESQIRRLERKPLRRVLLSMLPQIRNDPQRRPWLRQRRQRK